MEQSKNQEVGSQTHVESPSLYDALKCCLIKLAIGGDDKLFMDRNRLKVQAFSNGFEQQDLGSSSKDCQNYCAERRNGESLQENERVSAEKDKHVVYGATNEWNHEHADVSQVVNSPSEGCNQFSLDFLAFFAALLTKFLGFQFSLMVSFLTFPIWLSYFSFMFMMFPFRTLRHIRGYFIKKLLNFWGISGRNVTEKAQKSIGNIAVRFGCAIFWSSYVFFMLLGLLASGFVFGGLLMRNIVDKPVQAREMILNFDYTKTSPVAFVPVMPYSGVSDPSGLVDKDDLKAAMEVGERVIPHNQKLQLIISLTVPESDYNLKLGIFQVKVEFLSARGKVTASSSHPCILRYKSQPIRFVETIVKSPSFLAGFQSETQTLNVEMNQFIEGLEPTAYLKVMLESRAEYKSGAGIPEIYGASLSLESDLPRLKRLIWNWRKTIFVWTSIVLFFVELMFFLLFCRPVILPRGKPRIAYDQKEARCNIICWYRNR
ncbi:seipin-2 [Manihot esculenta]|nr:seipin-2 [Manihot esculenta]